ncbi:MAG: YfcC family protein [Anaerovoracaceae bacterium]
MEQKKRKFNLDNIHPYSVILVVLVVAFLLAVFLPSGEFDRVENADGEMIVVAGSYHSVEKETPTIFSVLKNVQLGYIDTAQLIFFIIIAYAFVFMATKNGTMNAALSAVARKLGKRTYIFIPISVLLFGLLGSTAGLYEEVYGLIPVFIGMAVMMGYDAVVGGAIVFVGVATGFAAAITNPFTIGIAQSVAKVPLYSGMGFRICVFVIFEIAVISYIMWYANKVKKDPKKSVIHGLSIGLAEKFESTDQPMTGVQKITLIICITVIVMTVVGTLKFGWYIDELAALFLGGFFLIGFISRYGTGQIMDIFIEGAKEILFGIMTIGFIRGAVITLEDAAVLDTITQGLSVFLVGGSKYITGLGMLFSQNLINLFITGGPAQAMATMPIMSPLCDLADVNRQLAVVGFQFGDGFSNMFWPTGVAIECGIMGIPMIRWYKFMAPLFGIMVVLQCILMVVAVNIYG